MIGSNMIDLDILLHVYTLYSSYYRKYIVVISIKIYSIIYLFQDVLKKLDSMPEKVREYSYFCTKSICHKISNLVREYSYFCTKSICHNISNLLREYSYFCTKSICHNISNLVIEYSYFCTKSISHNISNLVRLFEYK